MMALNAYIAQVQRFCRDQKQQYLDVGNITDYVNRARRDIALQTQSIRRLTPISGAIVSWIVTNEGSGYSNNPTLTITPPDFPSGRPPNPGGKQATANCIVSGGKIVSIFSSYGGTGYFQPQMTITDSTGSGATATPVMSYINQLNESQEYYQVSDVDLSMFPGVQSIYYIRSLSVIYANYRYMLPVYSFTTYQSMIRQFPFQYKYTPTFAAQFGQGTDLSFYAYPIPSQQFQWEFDALCLPSDLVDDQSVEALPDPWTDMVPYLAAHLSFLELQNGNSARMFLDLYEKMLLRYSNSVRIGRTINPYGRYVLPFILGATEMLVQSHQHLAAWFS
jgi:hypothetical protein